MGYYRQRKVKTRAERQRDKYLTNYLWEGVPTELLKAATAKAARQSPPQFLRFVLIELLREWTDRPDDDLPVKW